MCAKNKMWLLALLIYLILPSFEAQECNINIFSNVKVTVQLMDKLDSNPIQLNKCPISTPTIPESTIELWCSGYLLQTLPQYSIANLIAVEDITLTNNKISHINLNAFWNLPKLRRLNLKFNNIESVEYGSFNSIKSLESLNLGSNLIKNIQPDAFKDLYNLSNLDLSYNELSEWNPEWISYTDKMWSLDIQGNRLKTLPERAFKNNKKITTINLSHNEFVTLDPNTFLGLNSVSDLYLHDNKIEYFHPDTFSMFNGTLILDKHDRRRIITQMDRHVHATFSGISSLFINNNRLSYLPSKMFIDLYKTSKINFHSNPWQCACYSKIMKWANDRNHKKSVDVFKTACVKISNPICVAPKENPDVCLEEVNQEITKYFFDNYVSPDHAIYDSNDLDC